MNQLFTEFIELVELPDSQAAVIKNKYIDKYIFHDDFSSKENTDILFHYSPELDGVIS